MKKYKIKGMSNPEMVRKLDDLSKELVLLEFRHKNRQLDKVMRLREIERDIARLKTFIHEKAQEE